MRRNLFFRIGALLLVIFLGASCQKKENEEGLNDQISWQRAADFKTFTHPEVIERWEGDEEEMPIFWSHMDVLYPVTENVKLQKSVMKMKGFLSETLLEEPFTPKDMEELLTLKLEKELEAYNENINYYLERKEGLDHFYFPIFTSISDICDSLVYNDRNLVSIARIVQSYMGGSSHELDNTFAINFDLRDGVAVTYNELFQDPKSKELLSLVQSLLMQYFGVENAEMLGSQGLFVYEVGELFLPANFFFGEEGLILHYNSYEIGIYALGSIDLEVPYDALKPFLKEQYHFLMDAR